MILYDVAISKLEERIQDLCSKALLATDPEDVEGMLSELRDALHDYIQEIASRAAQILPRINSDKRSSIA
jgi:hypothetical protein